MANDQTKKSLRSFQCRDYLWEMYSEMADDLDCSVDYLVNEAMRQYAKSRGHGKSEPRDTIPPSASSAAAPAREAIASVATPMPARASASRPMTSSLLEGADLTPAPAPLPAAPLPPAMAQRAPAPSLPPLAQAPVLPPLGGARAPSLPPMPPLAPAALPPLPAAPPVPAPAPLPAVSNPRPSLFVIFNGQKVPVTGDEFVIGRSAKTAELAIKDGNISRRHAAVVFHGGAFYMKDLGSTNGVDFNGQKVGTKRIEEGDVFTICEYELRFTYG